MSFHASSCLILHADASYIIDIAWDWSFFFPILPVLATFWIAKTPIFFHFPTPNFCRTGTHSTVITVLKQAISPYFGIVWVLFYNISRFSMNICTKSRNLGWKPWKFQQSRRCFGSRNWGTDANHVRMGLHKCVMTPWRHEYLMSSKTGNTAHMSPVQYLLQYQHEVCFDVT